ncbi:MAG: ABC transporter substrate-binding protein [Treponema sp.]|jgi:peptide/nickel transport system substrate-binding protein|nr:ABC transporter substrate-binding protein [Treponema sp.]
MKKLLLLCFSLIAACVFALPRKDAAPSRANPLADARARQAIRYAIDMDAISATLLQNKAVPANASVPNGDWKVAGLNAYPYNPDKARQLLKEAGWNPNFTLTVAYYYEDQQTVDLMTTVQSYLADVGIKASFKRLSGDLASLLWAMPQDAVNGPSAVDWDLLYGAIAALAPHDYYNRYATGYAGNSHTPGDAKLDALIAATNSTADVARQKAAFADLERYENDTLFAIPLYHQPLYIFCRDTVNRAADPNGNAQYNYDWDIVNWTTQPDANGKQTLRTNSGPAQFFDSPWANPGVSIANKILFDRLILADGALSSFKGALAAAYEVAPDGMSVTFTLRDNIMWHDGTPITAQDVKWSVEYALQVPAIHAIFTNTFNSLEGAAAFRSGNAAGVSGIVIEGKRVTFRFTKVDPNMLLTFSQFAPLPQAYFAGADAARFQQAQYWQKPVGSGPFTLKEVKMNDYATFVPFGAYYGGVAKINEIQAYPSGENDGNLVVNANAGRLDYGYTKNSNDAVALEKIAGFSQYAVNMFYTRLFFVNKFPRK